MDDRVYYQIYCPSFSDSNGDGIGDLKGVLKRLPYLSELGIGGIWLTPFYPSPKVDNGYDISNYRDIDPDFGTLNDLRALLEEAKRRDIRVIADIVINHTSTAHGWFLESKASRESPKRDWYIWRDSPNNWESFFGGSAWELDSATGQYYYHSFAKEQADLNWKNPAVEAAILEMLDFWLDMGLSGFRFDVINNLTLHHQFPDNPTNPDGTQEHRFDVNQQGIKETIGRICGYVKERGALFTVGEISSDDLALIHSYTGCKDLDTTFNFNLGSIKEFSVERLFDELFKMNTLYSEGTLPTLFFGSHDMPRSRSRFQLDGAEGNCLMTLNLTFRAIPFLYFGDELGMQSLTLQRVEEARDVQGILAYQRAVKEGKPEAEAIALLNQQGRDASRSVMRWDESAYFGFSTTRPWLYSENGEGVCPPVSVQQLDAHSPLSVTKALLALRKAHPALKVGTLSALTRCGDCIFYQRALEGRRYLVAINFGAASVPLQQPVETLLFSTGSILKTDFKIELPPKTAAIYSLL